MGLTVSLLLGFIPMFFFAVIVYWFDRYEKEPKILLGAAFTWGAIVASLGAYIVNTVLGLSFYLVTGSEVAADFTTGSIIAPIVEESLKGFAVIIIFLVFRKEFDSVLDGIIYGAIIALGFAATENTFYIYTMGFQESGWSGLWTMAFVRIVLVGWQHPFYTAFIGIGVAIARLNRPYFIKTLAIISGWIVAVFAHSLHNTIASILGSAALVVSPFLDWTGWILMALFILYMNSRESTLLRQFLIQEVNLGIITAIQYKNACSPIARNSAKFRAINKGKYSATGRFYQLCAELAHKKNQYVKLGNEDENMTIINTLRHEIKELSSLVG